MEVALAYDYHTTVTSETRSSALAIATNHRRAPVAFHGVVKIPHLLRQLLIGLHEVIRSDMRWLDEDEWIRMLDPVITVHADQLFFEAFSNDQSSYVRLSAPLETFEPQGEITYGTTNIDFTWALREALMTMRSSRRTVLTIGPERVGVATEAGMHPSEHIERKVDVPSDWLKGFLQVQGALAMHPFQFDVNPVDLLSAIAFFEEHKPPTLPHGLRYEFTPEAPIAVALEPWEQRFTMRGTHYSGYPRTVRVWGRRRLALLRHVLPYADQVTIGVLGRGLPHYYVCHCGPLQFTLVLSGWTKNDWSKDSAFDALAPRGAPDPELVARVHLYLGEHLLAKGSAVANDFGITQREATHALFALARAGRVMYDPTTHTYRNRDLFADPIDTAALFAPDARSQTAQRLVAAGQVALREVTPPAAREDGRPETRIEAAVGGTPFEETLISVDGTGRIRFGKCTCAFFQNNLLSRGPCEHMVATAMAFEATQGAREDSSPELLEEGTPGE